MLALLVLFLIYTYAGATLEHINYWIRRHCRPEDPRKALNNPFITGFPVYGLGAFLVIAIRNFLHKHGITNVLVHFVAYASALTGLEYLTGLLVDAGPHSVNNGMIDSWDYSNLSYNYNGIVTLWHFLGWGLLGLLVARINDQLLTKIQCGLNC